jgi:hypothetical protein
MQSALLERVCPYCASNKLRFLEHGSGGTLFQCELCSRATVQRWAPEVEAVPNTPAEAKDVSEEFVFPKWFSGSEGPEPK